MSTGLTTAPASAAPHRSRRRWSPGQRRLVLFAALAAAVTAFLLLRLFAGGTIGLSDQGDGTRLLCSLGLAEDNPYNTSTTDYLYPVWHAHAWYGEDCGAGGSGEPYDSTELWFAALAQWLTGALTHTGGLDLRVLGVLFAVLLGPLVAGLAMAVPARARIRVAVAAALALVVGDGAFAGYFISAYSEPAGFVGLLAVVGSVVLFLRVDRVRWWTLLLLAGTAMFTVAAKTQTASLLVAVVPVLLARPTWRSTRSRGRAARLLVSRWPALAVVAALVVGTVAYLGAQPQRFTVQNDYAAVFLEMLPHSPTPAADLRQLGLPASMASSSGVAIDAPGSAASRVDFTGFTAKAGLAARMRVYASHPVRLGGMFERGLAGMGVLRADYVYSYPRSAGKGPDASECRVCVLQDSWKAVFGRADDLLVLLVLGCALACAAVAIGRHDRRVRALAGAGLFLAAGAVSQFWVVMLTEGASDLVKHLVFTDLMVALLPVLTASSLVTAVTTRRSSSSAR